MTQIDDPGAAFNTAFRALAPALDCRAERADDGAFLTDLFVTCSPLAGVLPEVMVLQQAQFQRDGYAATHPAAMRRIATLAGAPIGRLVIDWSGAHTHCVDVAVLPQHRATGAGPALLRAWLTVSDRLGKPARLEVLPDNPAIRLYARLGFVTQDGQPPHVTMSRAARPA